MPLLKPENRLLVAAFKPSCDGAVLKPWPESRPSKEVLALPEYAGRHEIAHALGAHLEQGGSLRDGEILFHVFVFCRLPACRLPATPGLAAGCRLLLVLVAPLLLHSGAGEDSQHVVDGDSQ